MEWVRRLIWGSSRVVILRTTTSNSCPVTTVVGRSTVNNPAKFSVPPAGIGT